MKYVSNIPLVMMHRASTVALDPDAQIAIANIGYTDPTHIAVVNAYFIASKLIDPITNGYCYGILGGTVTFHKWNWYNPFNTDAANRLAQAGTVTDNAMGKQGNGSNGTCNSFINPTNDLGNEFAIFWYSRTNQVRAEVEFGCNYSNPNILECATKYSDNITYAGGFSSEQSSTANQVTDTSGFFLLKRVGNTLTLKRNDIVVRTWTLVGVNKPNSVLRILSYANNLGTAAGFSNKQISHFEVRKIGTTDMQDTAFYNAVLAKETALGRNV